MRTDRTSELDAVPNPILRVEGAHTYEEAAEAMRVGVHAPERLSYDPKDPEYDAQWCRMVRAVLLDGHPIDDVISFDLPRGHLTQLVRDDQGRHTFEYRGPTFGGPHNGRGHLHYRRVDRVGKVTVKYGIPVEPDQEE